MKKKNIYIILSKTNTKMGKIIRTFTRYEYNHVSISLNKNFKEVYSFSRYYKNTPLVGGFTVESFLRYDKSTKIKIFEIPLDYKTYYSLKKYINFIKIYRKKFIYNTFSALFSIFKINYDIKNSYTCLSFIKHLFTKFNILNFKNKDFNSIKNLNNKLKNYIYYDGIIEDLKINKEWGLDLYNQKKNVFIVFSATIIHMLKLIYRSII